MSEHRKPDYYRQEAKEIRKAAEIVRDLQFREQLLGIAQAYVLWGHVRRAIRGPTDKP